MPFCKYCGSKVIEGEVFCSSCGKRLQSNTSKINNDYSSIDEKKDTPTTDHLKINSTQTLNDTIKIIVIIDGGMGQLLRAYNDYFVINTTSDFYEPSARKIYKTKGAQESEKGIVEELGEVGKEFADVFTESFAMVGESISSSYAEKRKKKLGVLDIEEGERCVNYAECISCKGVNVGTEGSGYISFFTNEGEEILFFFDGYNKDLSKVLPEVFDDVLKERILNRKKTKDFDSGIDKSINEKSKDNVEVVEKAQNQKTNMSDLLEQIKKLKELLDMEAITENEYESMKKEILQK